MSPKKENIILFFGPYFTDAVKSVKEAEKHLNTKFRIAFLMSKQAKIGNKKLESEIDFVFRVDIKNLYSVEKALMPIKDQVVAVNCRSVFYMPLYAKMISLFPHLNMPSRDSIEWCSNKLMMRRKFRRYYPKITPKYIPVHGARQEDVNKVKKFVGFPCVVKPASLAGSRLVSLCYHEEELQSTLRKTFRSLKSTYKQTGALMDPEVIVEQYMEGEVYSIDAYVDHLGKVTHLPSVYVKTGQQIGIDDFYNYRVLTPTRLTPEEEKGAQEAGDKAIRSLGLRSVMTHMEFVKLNGGWKVLEVDARMGGHRDLMYNQAFGIPHGMNDILTRLGEKPVIRKRRRKYVASFNIFPKKTGKIKSILGLKKVRELQSLKKLLVLKKVGDKAGLSKDGYNKVLDITLVAKNLEDLLADARRMEKAIKIEI